MPHPQFVPRTRAITNRILAEERRKRAVTGFGLTPGRVEGISRAVLSTEAQRASESERIGEETRLREQAREDALQAAEAQGAVNLLSTAANIQLAREGIKTSAADTAATRELTRAITGTPATTADIVAPAVAPAIAPAATGVSAATTEAAALEAALGPGEAVVAGGAEAVAGATATEVAAGAGLTVSAALGTFGFGMVGGQIGRMFHDSDLAEGAGATISGAIAGSFLFPGLGTVLAPLAGGIIGGISSLVDDTVICTELERQGLISLSERDFSKLYRLENLDEEVHAGYHRWASPVARMMRRSKIVTTLIRPLGVSWARTMANRVEPTVEVSRTEKIIGAALILVGVPICRALAPRRTLCPTF